MVDVYYHVAVTDKNGCFVIDSVMLNVTSGAIQKAGSNLQIYPNPFNYKTLIEFTNPGFERYELILSDLSGKIIKRMMHISENKLELNRDNIPNGIYLIELRGPINYRGKIVIR